MNSVTIEMLAMLPSWMKMRSNPENSTGAKFLDTIGTQLYDIERLIDNILSAHHLDIANMAEGIDITTFDILYKIQIQTATIDSSMEVVGYLDNVTYPLTRATSLYNFYEADAEGVNKYYIDTSTYMLYTKIQLDSISVNGALYTDIIEHSVWGPFDEIGLLLGCPRIPGERNTAYKARLQDVFQHIGSSTRQGLINFLSRSFGVSSLDIIINDLSDSFVSTLINTDGTLKAELKEYMLLSNKINLANSNVYWDILEENRSGLSYLPMVWNVSLAKWNDDSLQNGIGDESDIEVIGPEQESVIQDFTYYIGAEGLRVAKQEVYPEHQFKYRLFATGHKYDSGYQPENYKYSVIASELIPLKFNVVASKNYMITTPAALDGTPVDYTTVTTEDLKVSNYILKSVVIQAGNVVMNPNNRYVELLANLYTTDVSVTPTVTSITLNYKNGSDVARQIIVSGNADPVQTDANTITTGFEVNTWEDVSPVMQVRCDTNDQYMTNYDTGLKLSHGEYQRIYDSEGDWDDGDTINISTTVNGTLKLSI